jgi:replicative DNA helicase
MKVSQAHNPYRAIEHSAAADAERELLAALLDLVDLAPAVAREAAGRLSPEHLVHTGFGGIMLRAIIAEVEMPQPSMLGVLAHVRVALRHESEYGDARVFVGELEERRARHREVSARLAEERAGELAILNARRQWIDALVDAEAVSGRATVDDMAAVEERLRAAREALQSAGGRDAYRPTTALIDALDRWSRNEREPVVPTLFSPIDRRIGGLPIGLTGIGAKPGVGKSALAVQLTLGAMIHDPALRAVWFRGEMTNDLLSSKMLATWAALRDNDDLYCGFKDALARRPQARAVARDLALTIGDRLTLVDPPLTPDTIERHVAELKPKLVVVDYLQLCECPGLPDKRSQVEQVVRRLEMLSTRHELAIVVISAFAGSKTKESGIGELAKETNLLDYGVHTFVSLWGEDDKTASPREITLKVEKCRTDETGSETLWFDGRGQIFRPAADELHELEAIPMPCPALAQFAPEALR